MSKSAKALVAGVAVFVCWGIATMGAPSSAKPKGPEEKKPSGAKATTQVGKPLLPPLRPTTPDMPDITPEQEAELLAAMKESSPDHYYAYLMALRKSDPKLYRKALGYAWRTYEQWRDAPKDVRKQVVIEREATIEIGKLVHAIRREKEPAKRAELSAKLKQAVEKKFDAEVVIRDYRLVQFEQRVKTLRKDLKSRISDRENLVWEEYSLWLDRARKDPSGAKEK